jgi:hypothetical protein
MPLEWLKQRCRTRDHSPIEDFGARATEANGRVELKQPKKKKKKEKWKTMTKKSDVRTDEGEEDGEKRN